MPVITILQLSFFRGVFFAERSVKITESAILRHHSCSETVREKRRFYFSRGRTCSYDQHNNIQICRLRFCMRIPKPFVTRKQILCRPPLVHTYSNVGWLLESCQSARFDMQILKDGSIWIKKVIFYVRSYRYAMVKYSKVFVAPQSFAASKVGTEIMDGDGLVELFF